ncbi:hypothetical protein LCGC14_1001570 [marine sediment metagenome]|uniref:Uncharacterized protein n=1 Tax=marine sediment metagenome TaxID=412755 RepID=A0A0F9N7Q0_9ZZZZ
MSRSIATITFQNGEEVQTRFDSKEFDAYVDLATLPIVQRVEIKPEG